MSAKSFYRYTLIRSWRYIRWVFCYNLLVASNLFTLKRLRVFSMLLMKNRKSLCHAYWPENLKEEKTNNAGYYWKEFNFNHFINFLWSSQVQQKKHFFLFSYDVPHHNECNTIAKLTTKTYSVSKVVFSLKWCSVTCYVPRKLIRSSEIFKKRLIIIFYFCQKINGNLHRVETSIT